MSCAIETASPSFTSAAACFRLAGVMKFAAPSSSSLPQRPQFDSSFVARMKSSSVVIVFRVCISAVPTSQPAITTNPTNAAPAYLALCFIELPTTTSQHLHEFPRDHGRKRPKLSTDISDLVPELGGPTISSSRDFRFDHPDQQGCYTPKPSP